MPKRLSPDFKLSERAYDNLRKHGAFPEFVDDEMEMFMAYFLDPDLPDSKAKKSSWDMTCQRWMKRAWSGKAGRDWEYNRHKRSDSGSNGFQAFSDVSPDKPEKVAPRRKYKPIVRPSIEDLERMAGIRK